MVYLDLFGADKIAPPKAANGIAVGNGLSKGDKDEALNLRIQDVQHVISGVSITWLSKVFRIGRTKVERALASCPIVAHGKNGSPIYDVKTAAAYLVESNIELTEYLKTIDAKQLPLHLRETYWNAKMKEMKARTMAGDLWPTEAVLNVLGDTFQMIKSTVQLWQDTLEQSLGEQAVEQRELIMKLSDSLLDDIHDALVKQAENKATPSWAVEMDEDETS